MRIAHMILLTAGLLSGAAQANGPGAARGLNPDQLQAIRAVGRSVLAAKKAQATDPALTELHQAAMELRSLTKESTGPVSGELGAQVLTPDMPPSTTEQSVGKNDELAPEIQVKRVREKLAALEKRRMQMQAIASGQQDSQGRGSPPQMVLDASNQLAALERDFGQALDAAPEERLQQLAQIRQRLEPKRMRDIQLESQAPGLQPTLSTRTSHAAPIRTASPGPRAEALDVPNRLKVIKPKITRQ